VGAIARPILGRDDRSLPTFLKPLLQGRTQVVRRVRMEARAVGAHGRAGMVKSRRESSKQFPATVGRRRDAGHGDGTCTASRLHVDLLLWQAGRIFSEAVTSRPESNR
jgi:hypothetical protein